MDVIREFVLRGRMEIAAAQLPIPDITAFTKQLEEQNAFAKQQAEYIDEIVKRQQARDDASAEAAAVEKKNRADAAAAREIEKQAEKERKEAAEAAIKIEKEKQDAIDATNRARDAAIAKERAINDSLLKAGDSLKTGADGAFAFARGLTLIGLEGSSSFEQVARQVASVQAKFDLFRGSVDILKSGVETTRSLTAAVTAAGGAVALLQGRMALLAATLGPTGLVVAATAAATAAIAGLFQYLSQETDTYIEDTEESLNRFVAAAERAAFQARAAFEKENAVRATLEGQAKITAIETDLANIKAAETVAEIIEKERIAYEELLNKQDLTEEQLAPARDKIFQETIAAFDAALEEKTRRDELNKELLSATEQRDQGADREREQAIQNALKAEENSRREIQSAQEKIRQAEEAAAERERQIAIEKAQLSGGDKAFVDRISGNIGGATIEQLKELQQKAPTQFGQDVNDELTRRGGGTPAERRNEIADLNAELAALTQTLKAQTETRSGLQAADTQADAEAKASADRIREFLRGIAAEIEQIKVEQQKTESFYSEGNS